MSPIILSFSMKNILKITLFFVSLTLISCEEEIVLDFDQTTPRLVIEANIFVDDPLYNTIRLTTTTDFYSDVYPRIDDAQVQIKDLKSKIDYEFVNRGNGIFSNSSFLPENDNIYELTVVYKNEVYKATSIPIEAPEIIDIQQKLNSNFGSEIYEIQFFYQDDPDVENQYLSQMSADGKVSFSTWNDQFDNGNLADDLFFFSKEDFGPNDTLYYAIASIDKNYFNYLSKILSISGSSQNPFASPVGTIRGNIVNHTNQDNYALGYFHIAKRNYYSYIIK